MKQQEQDLRFMRMALEEAALAAAAGEIPVGAVLVQDGAVIAAGHNLREQEHSALGHAEIAVIEAGCRALHSWRLSDCTLYVTLEPCPMCAGAIINARIGRVVFGAADDRMGCCGSVANLFAMPFSHCPAVTRGLLAEESTALLQQFFAALRQSPRTEPKESLV